MFDQEKIVFFPPIRRFQTKSWDCLGQDWTGWNVNGNPGEWWLMTPTGVIHPFLNMAHVDIDQDGLPETQRIPKIWDDFSRVWIPNKHCIELSQHFPSNRVPRCWEHHGTRAPHYRNRRWIPLKPPGSVVPRISPGVGFVDAMWTKKSASDLDKRCSSWFINIAILCFSQIWNWKMIGILCWILCSST